MACQCFQECSCFLVAGDNVTVSGSGFNTDPWVINADDSPTFTASNTDGAIDITPGGALGHAPTLNLIFDPDSPAAISSGPNGISVECCGASDDFIQSTSDTDTVDLNVTLGQLTANVINDPNGGLGGGVSGEYIRLQDNPGQLGAPTCENRLRFDNVGNLTFKPDGVEYVELAETGVRRNVGNADNTPFGETNDSFTVNFTNDGDCPVYVTLVGVGRIDVAIIDGTQRAQVEGSIQLSSGNGSGDSVFGVDQFTHFSELSTGGTTVGSVGFPDNEGISVSSQIQGTFRVGAGNTKTFAVNAFIQNLENLDGRISGGGTTGVPDLGFIFVRAYLKIEPERFNGFQYTIS